MEQPADGHPQAGAARCTVRGDSGILVTGGGIRVGRALSLGLARAGARIVVHYNRSVGPAEATVAAARQLGAEAVAVQGDFSSADDVRQVAVELAPEVRVNAVLPGPVLPPPGMDAERRDRIWPGVRCSCAGGIPRTW